jgi:hypothetical protein
MKTPVQSPVPGSAVRLFSHVSPGFAVDDPRYSIANLVSQQIRV